jgi:hypothetical protein
MSRKLLIATIVLGSTCIPFAANAEAAANNPVEMPKDSWLSSMTPLLPELICKGFIQDADLKKRFDEIKMTYEQCVTLIPESTTKCQNELYDKIPATINAESAATWGRSLGECIGRDFAEKYLVPKQ